MGADRDIEALLEAQRSALIGGDLGALSALEPLLGGAELPPATDPQRLHALRASAARNLALLSSARRGVHAARRHFEEIAGLAAPATYDASGRRAAIAAPLSGRLHRA